MSAVLVSAVSVSAVSGIWASGIGRAAALSLLLAGCSTTTDTPPASDDGPPLPWARTPLAELAPPDEGQAALGRLLFYDPILSADSEVACATCHSEIWGMTDGLPLSIGVDGEGPTGPGRSGPNVTTRNSPTLWNVAYRSGLFWDGRTPTLEEQALLPIENEIEMDRDMDALLSDLSANAEYRAMFEDVFGEVSADGIAQALAAFQRTMVSNLSPYDRYVAGDEGALRPKAVDGMFAFAEAGCADCHAPPLFETERYADRGIGEGDDIGRMEVTGEPADRYAFRVPTLRNLRETGPYFHDGSVSSLEDAVAHEVQLLGVSGADVDAEAIASFIHKGLMDRSREPDRPETVPSGFQVPLDGFRIPR